MGTAGVWRENGDGQFWLMRDIFLSGLRDVDYLLGAERRENVALSIPHSSCRSYAVQVACAHGFRLLVDVLIRGAKGCGGVEPKRETERDNAIHLPAWCCRSLIWFPASLFSLKWRTDLNQHMDHWF